MRRRDSIILWPVYFDSMRTRREGRRLPKKFCVPSPSIDLLEKAVRNLGLDHEVYHEAAYPRIPWIRMGCIVVRKGGERKHQVLKKVALEVLKISEHS